MQIECRYDKLAEELQRVVDLWEKKNQDYSIGDDPNSNFRKCERIKLRCECGCGQHVSVPSWVGVQIRRSDKFEREMNLIGKEPSVVTEKFEDTLIDDVLYALLELVMYREWMSAKEPSVTDCIAVGKGHERGWQS